MNWLNESLVKLHRVGTGLHGFAAIKGPPPSVIAGYTADRRIVVVSARIPSKASSVKPDVIITSLGLEQFLNKMKTQPATDLLAAARPAGTEIQQSSILAL